MSSEKEKDKKQENEIEENPNHDMKSQEANENKQ